MAWYILFSVILLLQMRTYFLLSNVRRDDRIKFKFCDLQNRIVSFLCSDESLSLSDADYLHVRRIMLASNSAVHRFESLKPSLHFRTFLKRIREVNESVVQQETKMENTKNEVIQGFYSEFAYSVVNGFFAFTPFLRHELVFRVFKMLIKFLARVSNDRISRILTEIQSVFTNLHRRDDPSLLCHIA